MPRHPRRKTHYIGHRNVGAVIVQSTNGWGFSIFDGVEMVATSVGAIRHAATARAIARQLLRQIEGAR